MKIKGAELQRFMNEGWPGEEGEFFWDHDEFYDLPKPDIVYDTDAIGGVFYQGRGTDPTKGEGYDLVKLIRKWRKESTHEQITALVPKPLVARVLQMFTDIGAKVVK